jgi:CheY-like chemotaxis protein
MHTQTGALEELEKQLQDGLTHLHDRTYSPPGLLSEVMGCASQRGPVPIQSAIIGAIESLQPGPDIPRGAHSRRVYDVLYHRYVLRLTLEETAELLSLSVRHLTRLQPDAVHTLARVLWEKGRAQESPDIPPGQASDWRSQTERELASLQTYVPNAVSDVGEMIEGLLQLKGALVPNRDVGVTVGFAQPNLIAAIHPSVLRQILITAVRRLAQHMIAGQITLFARLQDGKARITATGPIDTENRPIEGDLLRNVLQPDGVSVEVRVDGDHAFLRVELPSVGRITVLVVDDNLDMVRFYRRSTHGTNYHIVHATQGERLFEAVRTNSPDIIVLDVMLPDADGWELLMRLHEDPTTQSIPVIVCSVIREEDLALSLGATLHLSKPVRPRQFIQALDQVLCQVQAKVPRALANNAAAC